MITYLLIIGFTASIVPLYHKLYKDSKKNKFLLEEVKEVEEEKNDDVNIFTFKFGKEEIEINTLNKHKTMYYLKEAVKHEEYLIAYGLQKHLKTFNDEKI